ncbi:MAG: PKD domain-containing protein [Methanomassiliicoccales archaeon]|nr:PKD domain-containing protein [Methanomassiliicoccales archaeon]
MRKRGLAVSLIVMGVAASLALSMIGTSESSPQLIQTFGLSATTDAFSAYFVLRDSSGNDVSSGGSVGLRIYDDFSVVLCDVFFIVHDGDFKKYATPTGDMVLGYIWTIEYSSMAKSDNRNDSLNAELSFGYKGNILTKNIGNVPFPPELKAPNKLPSPVLNGPTSGWSKRQVRFDASNSTDPNMDSLSFSWALGDGHQETSGENATYAYSKAGRYTVVLTVNDSEGGSRSVSHNITISDPEVMVIDAYGRWNGTSGDARSGDFFVNMTIRNQAPFEVEIRSSLFQTRDQEGQTSNSSGAETTGSSIIDTGMTARMMVFFEVPSNSTPIVLLYDSRIILPFGEQSTGNLTVHFFDVGQGDAILVESPDSRNMLIDCGPESAASTLVESLKSLSVTKIDILIATHPDADHIGGADEVLAAFDVQSIYHPGFFTDTATYGNFLDAAQAEGCSIYTDDQIDPGDFISFGQTVVQILNIDGNAPNSNSASIVLKLEYGTIRFIFTGDIDFNVENSMMANPSLDLNTDILKIAHHGSRYATSDAFLEAANPIIGVVSVGAGNPYGHPSPETLGRLSSHDIDVFRTDDDGTVIISTDGVKWATTLEPATISEISMIQESSKGITLPRVSASISLSPSVLAIDEWSSPQRCNGTTDISAMNRKTDINVLLICHWRNE